MSPHKNMDLTTAFQMLTSSFREVVNQKTVGKSDFDVKRMGLTKLYLECTCASILGLLTVLALYKIVPYIASAILFFVKFCVCVFVFALTMHMFKHSEIVQFIAKVIPYPLDSVFRF